MPAARSWIRVAAVGALALAYLAVEPTWSQALPAAVEYFASILPGAGDGEIVPL